MYYAIDSTEGNSISIYIFSSSLIRPVKSRKRTKDRETTRKRVRESERVHEQDRAREQEKSKWNGARKSAMETIEPMSFAINFCCIYTRNVDNRQQIKEQ